MDLDTVILLFATLVCHASIAYAAVYLTFRKYRAQFMDGFKAYMAPETMVPYLVALLKYRPAQKDGEDTPATFIEEITTYMGTQLGRYIAGMLGRANRGVDNAVLDQIGEKVPIVGSLMKVPGFKKWLNHPLVGPLLGPILEKQAERLLGGGGAPPEGGTP